MPQDSFTKRVRLPVVHETDASTHAPEWRSADCCASDWPTILNNEVSRADVVQQKVAERVEALASQRQRIRKLSSVERLATVGGLKCRYMTNAATVLTVHRLKQVTADVDICRKPDIVLNIFVLRRRLRSTHELREYVDILLFIFATRDARIVYARLIVAHLIETGTKADESTQRSVFSEYQAIGNAD